MIQSVYVIEECTISESQSKKSYLEKIVFKRPILILRVNLEFTLSLWIMVSALSSAEMTHWQHSGGG
jgi:hypothetical protein